MANETKVGGEGEAQIPNNGGEGGELDIDLDGEGGDKGGEGGDTGKVDKYANETPEARSARYARMHDQHDKKHGLGKYAKKDGDGSEQKPSQSGELDFGQKAFLNSEGIKGKEAHDLVKKIMKESGNDMETVISSKYFKHELESLQKEIAAKAAVPQGQNRTGNTTQDQVAYWLGKGEMPPDTPENRQLRRDIVNAKIKREESTDVFSKNPIQGG